MTTVRPTGGNMIVAPFTQNADLETMRRRESAPGKSHWRQHDSESTHANADLETMRRRESAPGTADDCDSQGFRRGVAGQHCDVKALRVKAAFEAVQRRDREHAPGVNAPGRRPHATVAAHDAHRPSAGCEVPLDYR